MTSTPTLSSRRRNPSLQGTGGGADDDAVTYETKQPNESMLMTQYVTTQRRRRRGELRQVAWTSLEVNTTSSARPVRMIESRATLIFTHTSSMRTMDQTARRATPSLDHDDFGRNDMMIGVSSGQALVVPRTCIGVRVNLFQFRRTSP